MTATNRQLSSLSVLVMLITLATGCQAAVPTEGPCPTSTVLVILPSDPSAPVRPWVQGTTNQRYRIRWVPPLEWRTVNGRPQLFEGGTFAANPGDIVGLGTGTASDGSDFRACSVESRAVQSQF